MFYTIIYNILTYSVIDSFSNMSNNLILITSLFGYNWYWKAITRLLVLWLIVLLSKFCDHIVRKCLLWFKFISEYAIITYIVNILIVKYLLRSINIVLIKLLNNISIYSYTYNTFTRYYTKLKHLCI